MKPTSRRIVIVLALTAMLLSACGAGASAVGGGKVQAVPTAYTGVVESMNGNVWTVNGQTIAVEPAVVQGGPFNVGDPVKIVGKRESSGAFTVANVSAPTAQDMAALPQFGSDDNSNTNSNDNANVNSNDDNTNVNSNDDNANVNSNDDNANVNSNDDNGNANSNDDNTNGNDNGNDNGGGGGGGGNDNGGDGGGNGNGD